VYGDEMETELHTPTTFEPRPLSAPSLRHTRASTSHTPLLMTSPPTPFDQRT
ncbi:unnamed protein product, partial [Ilex paraguariensis]